MQSNELMQLVGAQVKQFRRLDDLTLQELSDRTGVSKSALSLIERGESNTSIETLWRIAQALDLPLAMLLVEPDRAAVEAIPQESGPPVKGLSGMQAWLIAADARERRSELYDIVLPPGAAQDAEAHPPGATEVVVCVRGSARCGPVGAEVDLAAGDAVRFGADVPHRYAAGKKGARLVNLILTVPGSRT